MSYTHLKEREWYEDIYDRHTVEWGRRNEKYYDDFHAKMAKELPPDDPIDRPGNALLLNTFYMQVCGFELIEPYNERDAHIQKWMAKDQAKDDQLASARLTKEPTCQHCGKQGLRLIDKSLMRRSESANWDDPEEVLFMLHCPHCDKNTAVWEDGTVWRLPPKVCPKCRAGMEHSSKINKTSIMFIETCPNCGYVEKDKQPFTSKKEEVPDPYFEKDKQTYCLLDEEFRKRLFELKRGLEELSELALQFKEKEDNKHIYEAMENLKRPKIAELSDILSPVLEKGGYKEFSLDKPEMGRDVYVGFSCLDAKSDRSDYDSEKTLKKMIEKALLETNWRLMSDGINYRLGYLSGRLHAYEREEDLKKLVEKTAKPSRKPTKEATSDNDNTRTITDSNGNKIIL